MNGGSQLCTRARFWISLRVDDELSELEGALLDAHLSTCVDCRAFAATAADLASLVRAAPLEVPDPVRLDLPRAPRRRPLLALAAGAVIVALAIAGGLVRGAVSQTSVPVAPRAVAVVASPETLDQIRRLRRVSLLNELPIPRELSLETA